MSHRAPGPPEPGKLPGALLVELRVLANFHFRQFPAAPSHCQGRGQGGVCIWVPGPSYVLLGPVLVRSQPGRGLSPAPVGGAQCAGIVRTADC